MREFPVACIRDESATYKDHLLIFAENGRNHHHFTANAWGGGGKYMSVKGPYFIQKDGGKLFLGRNGEWYQYASFLAHPNLLCKFETLTSAKRQIASLKEKTAQPLSSKNMRSRLGYEESLWKRMLSHTQVGLTPAAASKDETSITGPGCADKSECEEVRTTMAKQHVGAVEAPEEFVKKTFETPLITDTIDIMERLSTLAERWQVTKREICSELRKLDAAIRDELHFVEFMDLDMRRAYKSYKRLHELRIQRRQLKNEHDAIEAVCTAFSKTPDIFAANAQQAISMITGLQKRKYAPRETWPIEDDYYNFTQEEAG